MIFYNSHYISNSDINSVVNVLKNEKISKGNQLISFENNLKSFFKCKYCLVVSSGTAAQLILAKSLNWKKKDNIILSPYTFVSGANSIALCGANPIFVDIKENDYNLDPFLVQKKVLELNKKKKKVKAIICTDYAGMPADWEELSYISKKNNIKLINDNCHALGSAYKSKEDYAIKYSDYIIQSFHAVKNITCGEGGALLTNDKKIYTIAKSLREHGFLNPKMQFSPWDYEIKSQPGFNFRLSDINCALGNSQLRRLKSKVKQRRKIARLYDSFFSSLNDFKILKINKKKYCSYHLYPIFIKFSNLKISPLNFYKKMKNKYKIHLQKHYIPTYKFRFYKKNFKDHISNFKNTERAYKNTFSLPIYEKLKINEVKYICNSILKSLKIK